MPRIASLIVLSVILLVIGAVFFHVMASFLLPVFLALLLVVMFHPLHGWMNNRCHGRKHLAAGLTTAVILLIFLIPLLLVLAQAASDSISLYRKLNLGKIDIPRVSTAIVNVGDRIGLKLSDDDVQKTIISRIQQWLTPVTLGTTQFVGNFLVGLFVMIVSLYYFLADGPAMIQAIMRLSPLDERYQQQLADQFIKISRAVVLATFASAAIQGLLAGLGLYLAGFGAIFFFTVLAMLLSMVPFVGPPAIWIPACLWLYFYEERTTAAIALAVLGMLVVSTVDNIVKPWILHGSSNLHPLLTLLSVLGGLQAMGPIGLFIGPMAVALLQTLLEILHRELETMKR
ncbi:MAG: AI-2E family transporter [Thermoguttaceae bacterium]